MIHLPVEIWRYILRYAIDCPEFLYIDLVPKGRPTDEATYWASERTRNALRGVCSSWNRFLATYCHRYIRISDIFHDTVPPASLPNATRIRIDECYCLHCNTFINDHVGLISRFEHYVNSAHTGTGATTWRVEIVDAEMNDYLDVIALEPSRISNLRALWHWRGDLPDNIFSAGPPLSIMGTCADDLAKMKRLDISKIKSIHIHDINQTNLGVVHFPNLTHACLEVDLTSQTSRNRVNQVFDWLEVHGKRLETFYWIDYLSEITNSELPDILFSAKPPLSLLAANAKDLIKIKQLELSNITTLSIQGIEPAHLSLVHLPNLTHVWFEMLWRPLIDQNRVHSILEWLRFYGKRLETFYWLDFDSGITDSDVDKVWSLCPNLQRLQLPVDARWTPPPSSHQIRLLRVEEHDEPPPSYPILKLFGPACELGGPEDTSITPSMA
ncbi:SubName: Full=Uncharacterized protein {ECO:0000313/EMBL:CCA69314.1} [Serendipita indica DSM 11827]|nr:SubName: Full=Uncharacterized protein {ECO:0000313/EMBL:CCA69314.1} [Serendipita indica DSM 11827]